MKSTLDHAREVVNMTKEELKEKTDAFLKDAKKLTITVEIEGSETHQVTGRCLLMATDDAVAMVGTGFALFALFHTIKDKLEAKYGKEIVDEIQKAQDVLDLARVM